MAALVHYTLAQRAAAAAGVTARAAVRRGLAPMVAMIAADQAKRRVLDNGQSAAGAVAAVRKSMSANGGAA